MLFPAWLKGWLSQFMLCFARARHADRLFWPQARASQEMLTSASLTVPIRVPTPQPTLTPISSTSPPLSEVPPPGKAAAAAAAAIDSIASGHSRSASGVAEPLRWLFPSSYDTRGVLPSC